MCGNVGRARASPRTPAPSRRRAPIRKPRPRIATSSTATRYDFFFKFFAAFPDITGTETADFFGLPPTDRAITVSGMDVLRVEDGKFVKQWGGFADQMDEIIVQLTAPAR